MIDPTRAWKVCCSDSGRADYLPSAVTSSLTIVKDGLTLAEAIELTDYINAEAGECRCPQHGRWLGADDINRMVRELDVAMNGDGAAQTPRLSDIHQQLLERIAPMVTVRPATDVPDAIRAMTARVVAERVRQQTDEGRTPDWDDRHTTGGLARAAACYALAGQSYAHHSRDFWPWDGDAFKPSDDPMRNLERAGALILAEMERLARS